MSHVLLFLFFVVVVVVFLIFLFFFCCFCFCWFSNGLNMKYTSCFVVVVVVVVVVLLFFQIWGSLHSLVLESCLTHVILGKTWNGTWLNTGTHKPLDIWHIMYIDI